nr:hypothetical protein [Tanacetum cinerariifolium]
DDEEEEHPASADSIPPPHALQAEIRRRIAEDIRYGIRETWIDPRDVAEEEALTTLEGVNIRVTKLAVVQAQDTQDIYGVIEDTQGRQTEIFQRVEALVDDSQYHYETSRLVEQETIVSREAWAHSIGLSLVVHFKLQGIVGNDAAYVMTWIELKKKITDKYCPRNEMKKIETKFWNLKVQGTDLTRAYAAGSGNRQQYAGPRPMCPKCNFNHDGPCILRCYKCNKIGHLARDYRSLTNANVSNNQRGNGAGQKATCYECGVQGHFKRNCSKLKNNNNNNRGNQVGTGNAQVRVYAVGSAGTNSDANTVT